MATIPSRGFPLQDCTRPWPKLAQFPNIVMPCSAHKATCASAYFAQIFGIATEFGQKHHADQGHTGRIGVLEADGQGEGLGRCGIRLLQMTLGTKGPRQEREGRNFVIE